MGAEPLDKEYMDQQALLKELGLEDINFDDLDAVLAEIGEEEPEVPKKAPPVEPPVRKEAKPKKSGKPAGKQKASKQKKERRPTVAGVVALTFVKTVAVVLCAVLTVGMLAGVLLMAEGGNRTAGKTADADILGKFDMYMTNRISDALEGIFSVEKVYWLNDSDTVAPKPNPDNFGSASRPEDVMWLLEEAADLIGDQKMIFNENTPHWEAKKIEYYYDETILVITWKQIIGDVVYNMSEVRIAHPSQFRRFLAGGEFGSDKQYITTDMAQSVNAVVTSSGDFYKYRRNGAVVYQGQLRRFEGNMVDTCFITDSGDLVFAYRGDLQTEADAVQFIQDNNVRFSLAFGPVLVDNGVACPPGSYFIGEIHDHYARAALCQVDELHYLLVSACGEDGYQERNTITQFARNLESFGVRKAYALDGGQTTVLAMGGKAYNDVEYGSQRQISDIIYFATALPEGE